MYNNENNLLLLILLRNLGIVRGVTPDIFDLFLGLRFLQKEVKIVVDNVLF